MNLEEELRKLNEESQNRKAQHDEHIKLLTQSAELKRNLKKLQEENESNEEKRKLLRAGVVDYGVRNKVLSKTLQGFKGKVLQESVDIKRKTAELAALQAKYNSTITDFIDSQEEINEKPLTKPAKKEDSRWKAAAYVEGEIASLEVFVKAHEIQLGNLVNLLRN